MIKPIFKSVLNPIFGPLIGQSEKCYAVKFDGVNSYGSFQNPLSFTSGSSIEIGFIMDYFPSTPPALYGPAESGVFHSRAIVDSAGRIIVRPVSDVATATEMQTSAGAVQLGSLCVFRLQRTENLYELLLNGDLVTSRTLTQPSAVFKDLARAAQARYFPGKIVFINTNISEWPMSAKGQSIQQSVPVGNPITLFNVVPESWEQIPCNLRP